MTLWRWLGPAALLLAVSLGRAAAQEPPVITWLHTATRSGDVDPVGAVKSEEDAVRAWLTAHLPGYRQPVVVVDAARMMALFQSTDGVCFPMLRKTEARLAYIAFSDRLLWAPPTRVIVQAAQSARFAPFIGADKVLDLDRLLADPAFTGAYETGRAYSPAVDASLTHYRGSAHLVDTAQGTTVYAMLAKGRVDWAIGYPTEAQLVFRSEFPDIAPSSYGIAGNAEPLAVFAGCSKRPLGEKIIADIDAALRSVRRKDPLQDIYDPWMDPDTRSALHRAVEAMGPNGSD